MQTIVIESLSMHDYDVCLYKDSNPVDSTYQTFNDFYLADDYAESLRQKYPDAEIVDATLVTTINAL